MVEIGQQLIVREDLEEGYDQSPPVFLDSDETVYVNDMMVRLAGKVVTVFKKTNNYSGRTTKEEMLFIEEDGGKWYWHKNFFTSIEEFAETEVKVPENFVRFDVKKFCKWANPFVKDLMLMSSEITKTISFLMMGSEPQNVFETMFGKVYSKGFNFGYKTKYQTDLSNTESLKDSLFLLGYSDGRLLSKLLEEMKQNEGK